MRPLDTFAAVHYSFHVQQLALETNLVASASDCSTQLLEVAPLIMRRIGREMRHRTMLGLSIPQFRALNYVRNHSGISLSDLAEFLGLTLPSTSKLIQRLVMLKVVTRRVAEDRRRVCLSLTEQGQKALTMARLETQEQLTESLKSLSQEDLAAVSAALQVLGRAFSKGGNHVNVS